MEAHKCKKDIVLSLVVSKLQQWTKQIARRGCCINISMLNIKGISTEREGIESKENILLFSDVSGSKRK